MEPETFFENLRDKAKVDFCALSDHDHGGVAKPPLWGIDPQTGKVKWRRILETANRYYEPGKFTTIPAYERDSRTLYSGRISCMPGTLSLCSFGIMLCICAP